MADPELDPAALAAAVAGVKQLLGFTFVGFAIATA